MKKKQDQDSTPPDDPIYLNARREALVIVLAFVIGGVYTVLYCYFFGYDLEAESVTTLLGIPTWVVWGIAVPWAAAILFSCWFGLWFVKDEDLGEEPEEERDES